MKRTAETASFRPKGFRAKLLVTIMLAVSSVSGIVLYVAERNLATRVETDLQSAFRAELATLHHVQDLRQAALVERCRALVRKPRIDAAIEEDALDILYPVAKDELRDLMVSLTEPASESPPAYSLRAEFYRFLDRNGALIAPRQPHEAGYLRSDEEARLALPSAPENQQIGYLSRTREDGSREIAEAIAMPIVSAETGSAIAALVLGFKSTALGGPDIEGGIRRGLWLEGQLHMPGLDPVGHADVSRHVADAIARSDAPGTGLSRQVGGEPHRLFYKQLNAGSAYPPAYEVCLYPLADLLVRQRQVRWQVIGSGLLLLLASLGVSHFLSGRLSVPVEKLAVDSAENLLKRHRAEAALETTSEELQRAARFSSDASHQLKTPVAVLRAGLEELRAQQDITPETRDEISTLIHQTYRLSGIIDDLLLLSRLDAGRLKLKWRSVNLRELIEAALDDLGAQPDASTLRVDTDLPETLTVSGDEHYLSLILQNLLENARKYNRVGGRILISARSEGENVRLTIGNTGQPISRASQEHIFERFHRGSIGENVPGYGLGLNLARELARLHQGELQLIRSEENWTEFEVRFRAAPAESPAPSPAP